MSRSKVFFKRCYRRVDSITAWVCVPCEFEKCLVDLFFALIIFRSHLSIKFETFIILQILWYLSVMQHQNHLCNIISFMQHHFIYATSSWYLLSVMQYQNHLCNIISFMQHHFGIVDQKSLVKQIVLSFNKQINFRNKNKLCVTNLVLIDT